MKTAKIKVAETGEVLVLHLNDSLCLVRDLKRELSKMTQVPSEYQSLLLEKSFKKLEDSHLQNEFEDEICLFLYNKRLFSEKYTVSESISLAPEKILDRKYKFDNIHNNSTNSSPLQDAYKKYELLLFENKIKADNFLETCIQCIGSVNDFEEKRQVQLEAFRAALSSFKSNFQESLNVYYDVMEKVHETQLYHQSLLDDYPEYFNRLETIPVEISIKDFLIKVLNRNVNNLHDCISDEKEFSWLVECRETHKKIEKLIEEVNSVPIVLNKEMEKLDNWVPQEEEVVDIVNKSKKELKEIRVELRRFLDEIQDDLVLCDVNLNESKDLLSLLTKMEERKIIHELTILPSMASYCDTAMILKDEAARVFNLSRRNIFQSYKSISALDGQRQVGLMDRVKFLRKWYSGRNDLFLHLQDLKNLPENYEGLIKEIIRGQEESSHLAHDVIKFRDAVFRFVDNQNSLRQKYLADINGKFPKSFIELLEDLRKPDPFVLHVLNSFDSLQSLQISDNSAEADGVVFYCLDECDVKKENSDKEENSSCSRSVSTCDLATFDDETLALKLHLEELEKENAALRERIRELEDDHAQRVPSMESSNADCNIEVCGLEQIDSDSPPLSGTFPTHGHSTILPSTQQSQIDVHALVDRLNRVLMICDPEHYKESTEPDTVVHAVEDKLVLSRNISPRSSISDSVLENQKISFRNFKIGDIGLFFPLNGKTDSPYYLFSVSGGNKFFLSEDCREVEAKKGPKKYILGQLIYVSEEKATASNIYGIPEGSQYYVVDIARIDP